MSVQMEKSELQMHDTQYMELAAKVLSWPEWKIQSFCLDQTDLRLLQTIRDFGPRLAPLAELSATGE